MRETKAALLKAITGCVLAVILCAPVQAQQRTVPKSSEALHLSFAPIVRRVSPAVVNVFVKGRPERPRGLGQFPPDDPVFRRFFGELFGMPADRVRSSLGSGVIVSPDGLIVTNTHVVKIGGKAEIRIVLADKREFDAEVVSQDEKMDVAVLRIVGADGPLPFLQFEDSDQLEVGDIVLAIGNPFGVGQTVTQGIVSALARSEIGKSDAQVFIQTDAAINPGNSGGALVDMAGKLVGINTAIYSRSGGSHGIGFAIPSNLVRLYAETAHHGGKVVRPWLGAKLEPVTHEIAEALGLDRATGALIARVSTGSPAADASLEPGDIILAVDGREVADPRAVNYRLATRGVGKTAELDVFRKGRHVTVKIALRGAPKIGPEDIRNLAGQHPLDGARAASLSPAIAEELGLEEGDGVVLVQLRNGSLAARLGFRPGDMILAVNDRKIGSVKELEEALRQRHRSWRLTLRRGGQTVTLQFGG
ncbi:MAG: Do family serine endopeptidase [Hyphomicrobiaceae bacterium]